MVQNTMRPDQSKLCTLTDYAQILLVHFYLTFNKKMLTEYFIGFFV